MAGFIETTMHPERYHGWKAKAPFFEGWYYKLVSGDERQKFAVIPGVIKGEDAHAFVQVLDGGNGVTEYYRYPLESFSASEHSLHIRVGDNVFWREGLKLNLRGGRLPLQGEVSFSEVTPWPVTVWRPGIMGPFAWLPKMECYHGVVSLDHALQGGLALHGQTFDMQGGRGYIEKDWGRAFPQAWVWMQSNHFGRAGVCLTASVAIIPWLGSSFPGFIIGLWVEGRLYTFATYSGARLTHLSSEAGAVRWQVSDRRYALDIHAWRSQTGVLKGPDTHQMGRRVLETLDAELEVRLRRVGDREGEVLFEGVGRHAGMEVENVEMLYK